MVTAAKVTGEIDFEREDLFAAASPAFFPVVGQIMEPGREFWPSVNGIQVKAVYNESEIALELKWHDMRAETSGTNAPDLDVPTFELDPFRGEAAGSASAGDGDDEGGFWGDEVEDEGGDIWGDEAIEEDEGDFWGEEAEEEGDFWGEDEGAAAGPSGTRHRVFRCRRHPAPAPDPFRHPEAVLHLRRPPEPYRPLVPGPGR